MKKSMMLAAGIFVFACMSVAFGSTKSLSARKDSSFISYHVYHVFHSVDGVANDVSCSVQVDSSTRKIVGVFAEASVSSFNSGNKTRDKTAMSAVEADKYPEVTFQSDSVMDESDSTMDVSGKLTFHGVTKEVTIHVVIPKGKQLICNGSFHLSFDDFNVKKPSLIFIPVADEFTISFHMVFDL